MMERLAWNGTGLDGVASVVALGVFDGVHLGHQELLRDAVALAGSQGVRAAVLTFEPDPEAVLHPSKPPPRITPADDRARLVSDLGIDTLVEMEFDEALATMPATAFLEDVLVPGLSPVAVVVGEDFVFGAGGAGDVNTLRDCGAAHGFDVVPHELAVIAGEAVTATRIRAAITEGDVESAAELLGRPFELHGIVRAGHGRGQDLGAPTANLVIPEEIVLPAAGVYACWSGPGLSVPAAVSVGAAPTFNDALPDASRTVEVHLIGEDVDLYGTDLRAAFVSRLRGQVAHRDQESLAQSIAADIAEVTRLLSP